MWISEGYQTNTIDQHDDSIPSFASSHHTSYSVKHFLSLQFLHSTPLQFLSKYVQQQFRVWICVDMTMFLFHTTRCRGKNRRTSRAKWKWCEWWMVRWRRRRKVETQWSYLRINSSVLVRLPLWAKAIPKGAFVYNGCASALQLPPAVG